MSVQGVDDQPLVEDEVLSISDDEEGEELPHVDFILTADFDVDAGPVITHQYPEPLEEYVRFHSPYTRMAANK
jgi:hypothetical protein